MEALGRLGPQLATLWGQLGGRQRLLIVGAAAGAVLIIVVLATFSSRTVLEPIYTNLDPGDASGIVEGLREQGVPFEITDGGRTILAPADRVLDLRLSFAASGLPTGGNVGFGIFDETSFTITDLTQRVNFQRALQGELERTIKALDSVGAARVLLVIPRQSLFIESQQPATASVMVDLTAGRKLPSAQVRGIRNLVASSVERRGSRSARHHDHRRLGSCPRRRPRGRRSQLQHHPARGATVVREGPSGGHATCDRARYRPQQIGRDRRGRLRLELDRDNP